MKKVRPLIPYIGGKSRVANKIVKLIPAHRCYAEVFAGGLSMLLAKPPSAQEVVNDFDTELIHLYKMIKFRHGEFLEGLARIPISRRLFEDWLRQDPAYMNDVYRAVRKLYLIRLSFGGKGESFGVDKNRGRLNHETLKEWTEWFWERTCRVTFECLDAVHFIQRYDAPETFFYLDPVYLGKEFYAQKFGDLPRHEQLRDQLAATTGKWILSHHECQDIRHLYDDFKIRKLRVPYSVSGKKQTATHELLISNY